MKILLSIFALSFAVGCASTATSSMVIPLSTGNPDVAIVPLDGALGVQAADLLSQELIGNGIAVVETSKVRSIVSIDTDLSASSPNSIDSLNSLGEQLEVDYLFTGTVTEDRGPLSSFPHVFITLRLIGIESGQTRWIGKYGDSKWTSAMSTQGDLKRGVTQLVKEFVKSGGAEIIQTDK